MVVSEISQGVMYGCFAKCCVWELRKFYKVLCSGVLESVVYGCFGNLLCIGVSLGMGVSLYMVVRKFYKVLCMGVWESGVYMCFVV